MVSLRTLLTLRRGRPRPDWTDWFSYGYLLFGLVADVRARAVARAVVVQESGGAHRISARSFCPTARRASRWQDTSARCRSIA